jgi:putative ABC transport system ATP-binding protein
MTAPDASAERPKGPARPLIRCKGLTKTYKLGGEVLKVLDDVSFDMRKGEFVSVMGPSGSGKTTLLNMLGALDSPTSGYVEIGGKNITSIPESQMHTVRRSLVGQIFQQFYLIPTLTALENLIVPQIPTRIIRSKAVEKAMEKLDLVGLSGYSHHRPSELSGGQQQRVAIARALVNEPSILLADEPTGNLDTRTGAEIMNLLKALNRRDLTILMVTHNPEMAQATSRIIHLRDGRVQKDERLEKM